MSMSMIKFIIILISLTIGLILVNLNNVISYGEDYSYQTTKTNNTNFDISNLVYDIDSKPFNVSYADWTEKWWQWTYSIPWDKNPAYDNTGKFCKESQKEPVWFFPGTYQQSVIRYCEIPYGVGIL